MKDGNPFEVESPLHLFTSSPLHPFIFSLMRLAFARGTTYYLRQAQFSADDAKVRKFA
jgi:hypothetical protein